LLIQEQCRETTKHEHERSVAEIAEPLVFETAQKAKKLELTAYFGGQPTLELIIAKFLEACTSDFIKPPRGN
jgi:hypothetical protein